METKAYRKGKNAIFSRFQVLLCTIFLKDAVESADLFKKCTSNLVFHL